MRKVLLTSALMMFVILANAQSKNADLKYNRTVQINAYPVNGYLELLPPDYNTNTSKKYPMIVMLHGSGEIGNGSSDLYRAAKHGPPQLGEKNGKLCINGECFIVISPQLSTDLWTAAAQEKFWDYLLHDSGYRYDPDRIYLTGLSLGAGGVWDWLESDYPDAKMVAAASVISGWGSTTRASKVTEKGVSVWAFHGTSDNIINYSKGWAIFDAVKNTNNIYNAEYKWTSYPGYGHNIWDITYRLDQAYINPNLFAWMASKRRQNGAAAPPPPAPNVGPTVSAGNDFTVNENTGSASISASANDPDGSIKSWNWTKISGPAVSMYHTNSSKIDISQFAAQGGTYQFKVTVTDDDGATASDVVKVTKLVGNSGGSGAPLSVNAGDDITLSGSVGSKNITANTTGSIRSYKWVKLSGPDVNMYTTNTATLGLSEFHSTGGRYVFRIIVESTTGETDHDDIVVIKEVDATSQSLSVNAGPDRTFTADQGSGDITASTTGSISSYKWMKLEGPSVNMYTTNTATLGLSNFYPYGGRYVFRLEVTDKDGKTAHDDIVVMKESDASPSSSGLSVSAGPDVTFSPYDGSGSITASTSGSISSYEWMKLEGPSVNMYTTNTATLGLSNFYLYGGRYVFRLEVTSSTGQKAHDDIVVFKESFASSSAKMATAAEESYADDVTVPMYAGSKWISSTLTIDGHSKYAWKQISGPAVNMLHSNTSKMSISDMKSGVYEFVLTASNDEGESSADYVRVTKLGTLTSSESTVNSTAGTLEGATNLENAYVQVKNLIAEKDQISLAQAGSRQLRVIVMGVDGRLITDEETTGSINGTMLSKGIYLYNLVDDNGKLVQKGRIIKY